MYAAVVIVHVICSLALILIVLLQAGKGTGIANVFGGAGQTVFGARTGDVLARGTEVCAGLFMTTSLVLATMSSDRSSSVMRRRPTPIERTAVPVALPMQAGVPQATMEKIKQAMAGITQTVKQAASTAGTNAAKSTAASHTTAAPQTPQGGVSQHASGDAPKQGSALEPGKNSQVAQQHDSKNAPRKPPAP